MAERQKIKKESHSNPLVKNFECGPLAVCVAFVERNELKELSSIFHCTKCHSLVVSASEFCPGGSGFEFIVPFDVRRLEHVIYLYSVLLFLGPQVLIVV